MTTPSPLDEEDPPTEPRPVRRLGKYQLLSRLAIGGMAEIYLARASGIEGFEKLVVIKQILPQLASNSEFVKMFLDEARIAATLHHSNIVQVFDIGAADGNFFIAMEYLHGADLARVMKTHGRGGLQMPLEHALGIIMGVCAGLHYAHEKHGFNGEPLDIVHRDVSPANVFVTFDGGVKLVDFGIAKASSLRDTETRYGRLKGKARYMSPEQCTARPLDRRSDVFAVSVILWELTTGRRLWPGATDFEVMQQVVEHDAPAPSTCVLDYPPQLEAIVMRGLRRQPEARYPTAQAMQADLEAYVREQKLAVSGITLGQFMRDLFAIELEAWHAAERAGTALADHLAQRPAAEVSRSGSVSGPGDGEVREDRPATGPLPAGPEPGRPRATEEARPPAAGSQVPPGPAPTGPEAVLAAPVPASPVVATPMLASPVPTSPLLAWLKVRVYSLVALILVCIVCVMAVIAWERIRPPPPEPGPWPSHAVGKLDDAAVAASDAGAAATRDAVATRDAGAAVPTPPVQPAVDRATPPPAKKPGRAPVKKPTGDRPTRRKRPPTVDPDSPVL